MDERDPEAEETPARLGVDQLRARGGELEALLADVMPDSQSSETVGTVRALPARD